jgi:hypothetical protein
MQAATQAWATIRLSALALALAGACTWLAPTGAVHAQEMVIYRCTDAQGQLTIQNNVPCPKGSKQVRRVMDTPPPPSAPYVPAAPVAAPAPPPPPEPMAAPAPRRASPLDELPPSTIVAEDRLPPPVLFECRTWDNDRYLSDSGKPAPRCVTMETMGLGGGSDSGAGAACEMKADTCQRVPDGALCDAWRRRLREAESALRFGASQDQEKARAELDRLGVVVRDSTCGL